MAVGVADGGTGTTTTVAGNCCGCGSAGGATCECLQSEPSVHLTISGFVDHDCGVSACSGVIPLSCLNASWLLTKLGSVYTISAAACGASHKVTITVACSPGNDVITGTVRFVTNFSSFLCFEFTFTGTFSAPGNSCAPLNIVMDTWTATQFCGGPLTIAFPDVTSVITE